MKGRVALKTLKTFSEFDETVKKAFSHLCVDDTVTLTLTFYEICQIFCRKEWSLYIQSCAWSSAVGNPGVDFPSPESLIREVARRMGVYFESFAKGDPFKNLTIVVNATPNNRYPMIYRLHGTGHKEFAAAASKAINFQDLDVEGLDNNNYEIYSSVPWERKLNG